LSYIGITVCYDTNHCRVCKERSSAKSKWPLTNLKVGTGGSRTARSISDSDILGLLPQSVEIFDGFREDFFRRAGEPAAFQLDETAVPNLFERLKAGRKVQ